VYDRTGACVNDAAIDETGRHIAAFGHAMDDISSTSTEVLACQTRDQIARHSPKGAC